MSSRAPSLRHAAPLRSASALALLLSGCGSVVIIAPQDASPGADASTRDVAPSQDRVTPADLPAPQDRVIPADVPAPRSCTRSSECAPGQECQGGPGCGVPWRCGPALGRPCTDDLAPFCGCDGQTFFDSSTCPGRPYARVGRCEPTVICALPNGETCEVGARCPLDQCTTCTCSERGELSCVNSCMSDGGVPARRCRTDRDCDGRGLCMGPEGCGVIWTCQTGPIGCTADLAPFCTCDARTVHGSSSCPPEPYRHRGPCVGVDAGTLCPPQDARGVGACDLFLGFVWDGSECRGLSGCRCEGRDCEALSRDPAQCEERARACR